MENLLGLKNTSKQDIQTILNEAFEMKCNVLLGSKKSNILSGKSVLTLFF